MKFSIKTLVLCLALAACSPEPADRPAKPAEPAKTAAPVLVVGGDNIAILVEPVDGVAVPMARLLAESVASNLRELGVPAKSRELGAPSHVLKGRAEANWKDTRASFIVIVRWTLADGQGKTVATNIQGVGGTWWEWENGDPRIIRKMGSRTAKQIAELFLIEDEKAMPPELLGAGLMVHPITGAPGDGNLSLTRSIAAAMRATDVSVTEDPRQAYFVLEGVVALDPAPGDNQLVRVTWTVSTLNGRIIGTAGQENTVAKGSLDGAWGEVAALIAAAAVDGIEDIIGRSRPAGKGGQVSPPLPPLPVLKRVPGRAPPPPM